MRNVVVSFNMEILLLAVIPKRKIMKIKQSNIIWCGKLYHSIESCILTKTGVGNEITSTIVGDYKNKIYKVEYHIKTTKNWETTFVTLRLDIENNDLSNSQILHLKKIIPDVSIYAEDVLPRRNDCR